MSLDSILRNDNPNTVIAKINSEDKEVLKVTYGSRNLFDISVFNPTYDLGNCSIVEQTTNGFILQGNQGNIDGSNGFSNGWFRPGQRDTTMYLKAGSVVTVSADYTALEFRYTTDRTEVMNKIGVYLFANPTDGNVNLYNINNIVDTENKLYKVTATFTIKKDSLYFPVFTLNSNKVKIENIQIEYGSTATAYVPYSRETVWTKS